MTNPETAPDWVSRVHHALNQHGFPVARTVAVDGRLEFTLTFDDAKLVVDFSPKVEGARAYRRTRRFQVSYTGIRNFTPEQKKSLDGLIDLIGRGERAMPPTWTVYEAAGAPADSKEAEFAQRFTFAQLDQSTSDGARSTEVLMRLTDLCNQHCQFCSAPPEQTPRDAEMLQECIDWTVENLDNASVTLTGGEPTIHPEFQDVLVHALAKQQLTRVLVQTNAVAFASDKQLARLPEDRRLNFFISLHAMDDEIYDVCTGSTGQLPKALVGIRNLVDQGHQITINTLACAANVDHIVDMLPAFRDHLAGLPLPALHYSILICPPHRPDAPEMLVPYSKLLPALEEAAELGSELGFSVDPLISSTHASFPPCLVSEKHRGESTRRPRLKPGETGYEDYTRSWVKAQRCLACAFTESCLGLPTPYAQQFGTDELKPIFSA